MTADEYLQKILIREAVDTGLYSPVRGVQATLLPVIREWAGDCLVDVNPSGSFAKGTANKSGTDIDLLISMSEHTAETLKGMYEKLFGHMLGKGYNPKRQNVSVNVKVNGYDVDLVPAKRQGSAGDDHSLYRRKADTWTKTNVKKHISHVVNGGRLPETRILKLWRNQKALDFPSFYLEAQLQGGSTRSCGGAACNFADSLSLTTKTGNLRSPNRIRRRQLCCLFLHESVPFCTPFAEATR